MDFDRYATNYREVLDRSVSTSGETGQYFASYKAQYLARILGSDFAGRILDYGCGIGLVTAELSKALPKAQLEAFDESEGSVANVSSELRSRARFCTDPSELNPANVIVIANVLHHVPVVERQPLIHQLSQRLLAGGCLAIFEHNPKNPLTVAMVRDCPFDEDAVLLPSREALDLCAGAGLNIFSRDYIVFFPRALAWFRPLEPSLRWCPLGAQYAIIANKNGRRM